MKHIVKVMAVCCAAALLLHAPLASAQGEGGAIVGWGSRVIGVDLGGPFVAVASGGLHGLGLRGDGSVVAWGTNNVGECDAPLPNAGFVELTTGGTIALA